MQINYSNETERDVIDAIERMRVKLGERSARATLARLVREADMKEGSGGCVAIVGTGRKCGVQRLMYSDRCGLHADVPPPDSKAAPTRADEAAERRAKRKGARS